VRTTAGGDTGDGARFAGAALRERGGAVERRCGGELGAAPC
jgi:hypothetical protein